MVSIVKQPVNIEFKTDDQLQENEFLQGLSDSLIVNEFFIPRQVERQTRDKPHVSDEELNSVVELYQDPTKVDHDEENVSSEKSDEAKEEEDIVSAVYTKFVQLEGGACNWIQVQAQDVDNLESKD